MFARAIAVAAIMGVSASVAEPQTPVEPCHLDRGDAMGSSAVPLKGWIRRGARCGARFSAPSAFISIAAAPAHGALIVDQNEMVFIYTAPKDYVGPVSFTVMLSLDGQSAWFHYDLDVR